MFWLLDLTMIILAAAQFQRRYMLVKLMLKKQPRPLALKLGIIKMIMIDYKNTKPAHDTLTFWDYAAAAGFILTMLLLIIGV